MIHQYFTSYFENLKATLDEIDQVIAEKIIKRIIEARNQEKQIFIIGNGGSASAASHFACDLAKGTVDFKNPGFKRFRAISLTDNMALITAIGNDISYEEIFVEQLKNYLNPDDVVIVITGSGNSPNILKAIKYAAEKDATTIGFLGFGGGKTREMVDIALIVSSQNYGISEDFHLIIEHVITQIIRRISEDNTQKVFFLDRDGIINTKAVSHGYITSWDDFRFRLGAVDMMKNIAKQGYRLVILTNQQCVGKGILSNSKLEDIHEKMCYALDKEDICVDKVFTCPHKAEDRCFCRKPKPGLFYLALNELNYIVDISNSLFIGDSESDIIAGNDFGISTIYLTSIAQKSNAGKPDFIISDLSEVKEIILKVQ